MAATTLAEALNDCLINFDSRILVTDLLQEYNLSYDEVHKTLEEYIKQQENKGAKYEKRFLVQGFEHEGDNEIYTVVKGETKLREWMEKLKNVESRLYAVEVSGGARTPAQIFKPVEKCIILIDNMEERVSGNANSSHLNDNAHTTVATTTAKSASAASKSTKAKKVVPFTGRTTTIASANVVEKELIITAETEKPKSDNIEQPSTQSSPKKTKAVAKKNTNKSQPIAISNFFTAAAKKPPTKPVTETKPTAVKCEQSGGSSDSKSAVTLTKSTKQADDIMKLSCTEGSLEKSSESSDEEEVINANKAIEKQATTNKRSYVFDSTSEPTLKKSLESSDEEEVISAMKLDIINSDNETEEQATTNKRRRVIDSDSDNEPEQKHEKIDVIEVAEEEDNKINKSETFLDDEDFVVTVKSKGKPSKKTSPRLKPPTKMPAKRKPPTASTKTKQVNITDFFGKK